MTSMHTNLNFEVVALLFGALIFLNHCFSYTDDSVLNRIFRKLALLNILAIAFNIAAIMDLTHSSRLHVFASIFYAAYFILGGWTAFVFSVYIDNLLQDRGNKRFLLLVRRILTIFYSCAIIANLVTGTFYTISDGLFLKKDLFSLVLIIPFSMILYTAAITFAHMGKLTQRQTIPAFVVMLIIFAAAELQKTAFPQIELIGTATTVCLLIILFTLEAPERQKMLEVLEVYHTDLEKNIKEKNAQVSVVQNGIINGLADLLSGRSSEESNHCRRCAHIVQLLTDKMRQEDLSPQKQKYFDDVVKAAPLHDIGDSTSMEELFSPESNMIRKILGDCSDDDFIQVTENMVRYHRTRYDGIGAMDNNIGEFIPLEARIMAMAEAFDDYIMEEKEEPVTVPVAMKRIWDEAGTLFDPTLLKYIFACRDGLTAYYQEVGHAI